MSDPAVCRRCVLPEAPPNLHLDDTGLCNVCREWEQMKASARGQRPQETDFTRLLKKHRGKGDYDCLVMCSGGKDSTASLVYMKERYKLRVLAFTFDHGFETEEALANVRRAVSKLDVDFLTFRSTYMHGLFRRMLLSGSRAVICHLCSIWYMDLTFKMAARFRIPVIIAGWTKGQSRDEGMMSKCACNISDPEFRRMGEATVELLKSLEGDPVYGDLPRSMEEVLKRARKRFKSIVLSPHWFLPYDTEDYVEMIRERVGWVQPKLSYPGKSTNCALNFISVHNSMRHYGYTHYHVEMSKLIREGLMTREEAVELLALNFDEELLSEVAEPLGVAFEAGPGGRSVVRDSREG
jgi:hypothetical protein